MAGMEVEVKGESVRVTAIVYTGGAAVARLE
jgi:hypothetical protein